jgi:hypothetical protein
MNAQRKHLPMCCEGCGHRGRRTILDAFGRAGMASVEAVDLIECHDCFSITE